MFCHLTFSNNNFPSSVSSVSDATIVFFPQGWACDASGNSTSALNISIVGEVTRGIQVVCSTGYVREV